jgi:HEAT repeat protein
MIASHLQVGLLAFLALPGAMIIAACPLPHGGQYRGAGDVQPPPPNQSNQGGSGGGGSGGAQNNPGGSSASATGGPASGGASPVPSSTTMGTRRGITIEEDGTRWESWWEFGKDPYLRLRETMIRAGVASALDDVLLGHRRNRPADHLRPSPADLDEQVIPALRRALAASSDRDTCTGCLVALAKIGRNPSDQTLHDIFLPWLQSHDQEIRETAALCFGVAQQGTAHDVDVLVSLVCDLPDGRQHCGRAAVDERTRSFAAYGLGILLGKLADPKALQTIVRACDAIVAEPKTSRNLRIAAIAALAQLRADGTPATSALIESAVQTLVGYYTDQRGAGELMLQAHVPTAVARLLGPDHPRSGRYRDLFAADLLADLDPRGRRDGRADIHMSQSCALSIGAMATPWLDDRKGAHPLQELLVRVWLDHPDHQTRAFALLGIARAGGPVARQFLLRELGRANKGFEKPWVALALAQQAVFSARAAVRSGTSLEPDRQAGNAILADLRAIKNPGSLGALAIALGLLQYQEAAPVLRSLLEDHASQDALAGHLCISLALLGDHSATTTIQRLLDGATRRPVLLVQAATALGRLGDRDACEYLCRQIETGERSLARLAALAGALGQIGDRRSLAPLMRMLADAELTPLTRAFAAVALGGVCDQDPLPWNARFAELLNYRAATETLTDGVAGILDIL